MKQRLGIGWGLAGLALALMGWTGRSMAVAGEDWTAWEDAENRSSVTTDHWLAFQPERPAEGPRQPRGGPEMGLPGGPALPERLMARIDALDRKLDALSREIQELRRELREEQPGPGSRPPRYGRPGRGMPPAFGPWAQGPYRHGPFFGPPEGPPFAEPRFGGPGYPWGMPPWADRPGRRGPADGQFGPPRGDRWDDEFGPPRDEPRRRPRADAGGPSPTLEKPGLEGLPPKPEKVRPEKPASKLAKPGFEGPPPKPGKVRADGARPKHRPDAERDRDPERRPDGPPRQPRPEEA